jgi:hypothetical protein
MSVDIVFLTLLVFGPVAGFLLTERRPGHRRRELILGSMLGGAAVGLLFAAYTMARAGVAFGHDLLPWVGIFTIWGLAIGIAGVLALWLGTWLAGRA